MEPGRPDEGDCDFLSFCLAIMFSPLLVACIVTVILPPPSADYEGVKFGINSLSVSSFNISESKLTGNWEIGFIATNHDLRGAKYKDVNLSVSCQNQLLTETLLPNFMVLGKETKSLTANPIALAKKIDDTQVADAIARDWAEFGVVTFTIRLGGTLDIEGYNHKKPTPLNVTCANIAVGFLNHSSSQGKMLVAEAPQPHRKQYSSNNYDVGTVTAGFSRCSS